MNFQDQSSCALANPNLLANPSPTLKRRRWRFSLSGPILLRELRTESRSPFNYWLRVLGAGTMVLAFVFLIADQRGSPAQLGARVFRTLNSAVALSIILIGPVLTADCLSREKREGTLGLLFLTKLQAQDIVLGKSLIHSLRALTLVIATLPIIIFPFVLGGVSSRSVMTAITENMSHVFLALAAGLFASSRNTEWVRAVVTAELLSLSLAFVFDSIQSQWKLPAVLFIFILAIDQAGKHLRNHWQFDLSAPPRPSWVRLFSDSAFWRRAFRWNTSRTLDRNPIAWLQEYSWTARLAKWGWLFFILAAESYCVLQNFFRQSFFEWQLRIELLLVIGMAFSAAWSFQRERENGALELLLVTPLSLRQIIFGRAWGLWCHFFPAFATVTFIWSYVPYLSSRGQTGWIILSICTFLTLPFIGLNFSVVCRHFLVAWLATLAAAVLLPWIIWSLNRWQARNLTPYLLICATQIVIALAAGWSLRSNLAGRRFLVPR